MPSSAEVQEGGAATYTGPTSEGAAAHAEGWDAPTSLLPSIQPGPRACGQFPGHILKAMFSLGEPLSHCSGLLSVGGTGPQDQGVAVGGCQWGSSNTVGTCEKYPLLLLPNCL